ncbi:hypothetical protein HD806DRAFT_490494 [Xylariaceae sp. AK1471]|nr:hypothetical protein HD806DRAFT_490494 [Xylariaceae sp. AK1471]
MRFSLIPIIAVLASVSVAVPTADGKSVREEKRNTETKGGDCNGTSCQVVFANFLCNVGSCVGPGGGDGARCTVVDYPDGSRTTFCPGCGDSNLC